MQFIINKEGTVEDVRSKALHPRLEAEAIRIAKMLPQMQPAMLENIPVNIRYRLPILYKIKGKEKTKKRRKNGN